MIRLFARPSGRHVPRPARPVPYVCLDCERDEHGFCECGWCEQADRARVRPGPGRPSWRERLSSRLGVLSAWWDRQFYDPWHHGLDARDIAEEFGREVMPLDAAADEHRGRPVPRPALANVPRPGPEGARDAGQSPRPGHPRNVPRRGGMMEGPEVRTQDVPVHAVKPCAAPGGPDVPRSAPRGPRDGPGHCPNCGRPAYDGRVCGACGWGYGWQPACEAAVAAVYAPGTLDVTPQADDPTEIFSQPRQCAGRDVRDIWQPPARPLEPWIQALLGAPSVADAMRDIITGSQRPALAGAS